MKNILVKFHIPKMDEAATVLIGVDVGGVVTSVDFIGWDVESQSILTALRIATAGTGKTYESAYMSKKEFIKLYGKKTFQKAIPWFG